MIQNRNGLIPAFMCAQSGLLFPGDYVDKWGVDYGIGLGPTPCSEVLQSDYSTAPPALNEQIESLDQIMHPLVSSKAPVHLVFVTQAEFDDNAAILHKDDPKYKERAKILKANQLENPLGGKLRSVHAAFNMQKGGH